MNTELVVDGMLGVESRTVVLATHDLSIAKRFARVVALRDGNVIYDGPSPDADVLAGIYGTFEEAACV